MVERFVETADAFVQGDPLTLGGGLVLQERPLAVSGNAELAGVRVQVAASQSRETPLAQAVVALGEHAAAGLPDGGLDTVCVVSDVHCDSEAAAAALGYAVARRARIFDRVNLVFTPGCPSGVLSMLKALPCEGTPTAIHWQRVDAAAHYAAAKLEAQGDSVVPDLRGREVRESAERWLATGKSWGFFEAVAARRLTRPQYIYALTNVYQFVRETTRLAARAIAHSPTTEMRSHFINHLNGEINHELIIERDLDYLGEDVALVRDHSPPNGPTQAFMAIQESLIGYREDPVLLLASPVAAEGVTAHLDEPFIEDLKACLAGWGVEKPMKACRFFSSHMHTDGGADGHWEMTFDFLGSRLRDESHHQLFVRSMRTAMHGTRELYESFVRDIPSWAGTPAARTAGAGQEVRVQA